MPNALHTPSWARVPPVRAEPDVQIAKRIEKIRSLSSSHRTAGTVEIQDQDQDQATVARAYQIWEENGRMFGHSERDWHQAVEERDARPRGTEGPVPPQHDDGISPYFWHDQATARS